MRHVTCLALVVLALVVPATGCGGSHSRHVYRVPSSAIEPTLHCARPAFGCEANVSDLIAVESYGDASPQRGDIVVLHTPALAVRECGAGASSSNG